MKPSFRSGYAALIGRPNVGKSTFLNSVLGQKIAIVSRRRQTTRNRITGIKTVSGGQIIFLDTPGIHKPQHALGEAMLDASKKALQETDAVIFVTDAEKDDSEVLGLLSEISVPVVMMLNKADLRRPEEIENILREYSVLFRFAFAAAVSSHKGTGIEPLISRLLELFPEGPKYFDDDMVTDQYERFMASEIIREKIIKNTSEEVPHSAVVEVEDWKDQGNGRVSIRAVIYIEREGQKGILIGKKGEMLKRIGQQARMDIEDLLAAKVFLELWVKVRKGWRDDKKMLHALGYR